MANINPTNLTWRAPTTNTDGTPIQYELSYELGVVGPQGDIQPYVTVVGSLRETDDYVAPISDMQFSAGEHQVVLRALAENDPQRASEWSQPVTFIISDEIPNAPLDVAVS